MKFRNINVRKWFYFWFSSTDVLQIYTVNFKCGGSCIDYSDWIKKKKATINPKKRDDKCFQYAVRVALKYGEIELHPERVSNVKPLKNKYNWRHTHKKWQSGNLYAATMLLQDFFTGARLRRVQKFFFTKECSTLFVSSKIKQYYRSKENHQYRKMLLSVIDFI